MALIANREAYAQTDRKDATPNYDSIRVERQRKLDSTRAAMKRYNDSMSLARQQALDSTRAAMKRYNDSMRVARQHILDSTREAQQAYNDSVRIARQHTLDSTRKAQKRYFDSLKVAREHIRDSVTAVREHFRDSINAIREYRQSKRYKDSVTAVRTARLDSIKAVRAAYLDSVRTERKRRTDSMIAARKHVTDSIKAIQKQRSDSLARIREYRQSKRYKDSVSVVRQMRLDSIKAVRTAYYDSLKVERKRVIDSTTAVRKAYIDSLTAARKVYTDSLKAARQVRADSLAKLREKREKEQKARAKERENRMQLALEVKIQKKREAWSNEQMLKKKWSLPRQLIQNTFTRYNYYFNADRKMDEALDNMQRFRRENYDSLLALYPFDPDRDSAVLAPDMDSIIQNTSLGIQIHDPRTKWGDDLYLLLGQAYYYKADYENATTSFRYVVSLRDLYKKKKGRNSRRRSSDKDQTISEEEKSAVGELLQHRSVHNEAIFWLARTYSETGKTKEAESVLDLLESDKNFPEEQKGRLALEKAYVRLQEGDLGDASKYLPIAAADKQIPGWIRMRAAYLNGQILQSRGEYEASANSFQKSLDLHPKIEMDFYARKNLAYSKMLGGDTPDETIAMLEGLLKDGKYAPYYEQVYFILGRLAANAENIDQAVEYLTKGIESPKSTPEQKAQSYATLGNIYYGTRAYEQAKNSYDSALAYAGNMAEEDTTLDNAVRRAPVLENLTQPLRTIREIDSLLYLASLDDKEQRSIVRKYIKELEQKRADSIFQAENAGLRSAQQNQNNNSKNKYANWYFSNASLMQKGYNSFKQKWGNRPLSDDWRRSSGNFAAMNSSNGSGAEETEVDNNGIPTEESLLAYIPTDPKDQDTLRSEIRRAYVDASTSYIQDLEDYDPAVTSLDTLDKRFPSHEYKAEEVYLRYLIALRKNDLETAKKYRSDLVTTYSDTKWAERVKPTEDGGGMISTDMSVSVFYDETYRLLMQRQYEPALARIVEAQKKYNDPYYKKRFQIMMAIALAGTDKFDDAEAVLGQFISTYPKDELRSWADAVLDYIRKNKPVPPPITPTTDSTGKVDSTQLAKGGLSTNTNKVDSTQQGQQTQVSVQQPAEYKYDAQAPHYVLVSFPGMESRSMGMKSGMDDFNKFKFSSLNLSVDMKMLQSDLGLIIMKTFPGAQQAKIYMNALSGTDQIFREYDKKEYDIVMISVDNYTKLMADKDWKQYLSFYKKKYK